MSGSIRVAELLQELQSRLPWLSPAELKAKSDDLRGMSQHGAVRELVVWVAGKAIERGKHELGQRCTLTSEEVAGEVHALARQLVELARSRDVGFVLVVFYRDETQDVTNLSDEQARKLLGDYLLGADVVQQSYHRVDRGPAS